MRVKDIAYISREFKNSTLFSEPEFAELSEALEEDAKEATCITIVSGYFGVKYIENLLKKPTKQNRAKCTVQIILGYDDTAGLIYGSIEQEDLCKSIISMGYRKKRVTVRLFKDSVPLHTKLYGFLKTTAPVWYVGSANASSAIEGNRHELMLRITGRSEALEIYVDTLLDYQSLEKHKSCSQIRGFQEYLSNGSLIFKPTRYRRFTYDAFLIPPTERKKFSDKLGKNSRVPHADPNAEGFGFNLLSAIGMNRETKSEKTAKLRFRQYCVETKYGYWAPDIYVQEIENAHAKSRNSEKEALKKIKNKLANKKDNEVLSEFKNYQGKAEFFFKDADVKATPKEDPEKSFLKFLEMRRAWLSDEAWIERNAGKITISPMPNIWSDENGAKDFITSFIDDVVAVLNTPGNNPRIYRQLQSEFGIPLLPGADDVRLAIRRTLGNARLPS